MLPSLSSRFLLTCIFLTATNLALAAKPAGGGGSSLQFSAASYSVSETGGSVTVSVTRTGSTSGQASVSYATSNGSASSPYDYTPVSGTLYWGSNDASPKTFVIPILDDSTVEGIETINVSLSNPSRATLGAPSQAVVEIQSDDQYGQLQFSAAAYSAAEGGGQAVITVNRVNGKAGDISVHYVSSDGTARAGQDYQAVSGDLVWANGDSAPKTITVPLLNDNIAEPDETVNLKLTYAYGGATLGTPVDAVLTIANDDQAGILQFSRIVYRASESDGEALVTVERRFGADGMISVAYATADGTANAGSDYQYSSGALVWADGDAAPKSFTVPVTADGVEEGLETVALVLSNPSGGATLTGSGRAMLALADADGPAGNVIDSAGGDGGSQGGSGGRGADVTITKQGGTGPLEVRHDGSVDAGFTPTAYTPDLGVRPLVITQDTYIPLLEYGGEPPAGTVYIYSYDDAVHVSDGDGQINDDDTRVTGIQVNPGATLRLGHDYAGYQAQIFLSNDLVNHGTITVPVDSPSWRRSGLELNVGNYVGTGVIDTSGVREGQHAGFARVYATGSIYNSGEMRTYGGDSRVENGGQGGDVWFKAGGVIENTGRFLTRGGSSFSAAGGNGGGFRLDGFSHVRNAADHDTSGGDGVTAGGRGTPFVVQSARPAEVRFTGSVDCRGGSAIEGTGGDGGGFAVLGFGSTIRFAGNIDARGGHTLGSTGNGGNGGLSQIVSQFYDGGDNSTNTLGDDVPAGDIYWSGSILASGGASPRAGSGSGGMGGTVIVDLNTIWHPRAQQLHYTGLARIRSNGGSGALSNEAGKVTLENKTTYDVINGGYPPAGSLSNSSAILARGGGVLEGATGGLGQGSRGGRVELNGYAGVSNSASIDASGGHDRAALGASQNIGGLAGYIYLQNTSGLLSNSGALAVNGGDGLRRGGNAGTAMFYGPVPVQATNSGNFTANGGNADPGVGGSVGGNGGILWFNVDQVLSQTGAVSFQGGTGQTPGYDGYAFY
ncbi:hypothetical protein SCL_1454 [Sulfuricaulis limicola]|uniref:Calx-beta domain-containing protein n=1 Tax=Sulfuricaulis limicola TaxID=1620215 RepID=A0A1B4XG57_9GAMM|nr:Calx-beta domain-containing protein [Sulfuricaulis limicola]BAV33765.1 hypothetical protein SCL_1454 [Sulfuricaulis limicola]